MLVAGLAAVLIIWGIPEDIYLRVNKSIEEYRNVKSEFEAMSENFRMKGYYERKKKEMSAEIKNLGIKTQQNPEQVLSLISYHCENNGIEISRVSFDGMSPDMADAAENEEPPNESEGADRGTGDVLRVAVEFNCGYENMLQFIDDIKNDGGDIAVTNMRVLRLDDDTVNAVTNLNFYSLNTLNTGI